jgi:CDP-diacylglycerol--serine O-phosphatidyltransferase
MQDKNSDSDTNQESPQDERNADNLEESVQSVADAVEENMSALFEVDEVQQQRSGLRRGIYLLPNLITTGALFSGFYAMIAAMSGSLENAAIAIVIAGFLDSLDGRVARMTNTTSEFGVQYDSLSDMVAFGVAPAVLMFSFALSPLGKVGWAIAFMYMACAALRLARFNTMPDNKVFYGLASPMASGTLAAMVWVWADYFQGPSDIELGIPAAIATVIFGLLMVSNVQYYNPKLIHDDKGISFVQMLGIVMLFAMVFANPPLGLLIIGTCYAASGPIRAVLRRRNETPA